jgi:hypothetical protein
MCTSRVGILFLPSFLPINWGVPRGSILGPLVFLIFINELPAVVENVDDNTPMYRHKDQEALWENLEEQAFRITTWFQKNKMIVSGDKTKFILIGTHANRNSKLDNRTLKITVDGHDTPESESEKILGIIVNKAGTWKHLLHGNEENLGLLKDLSKRIGMLGKLRRNLPVVKFKMLVSELFSSKIIYGISAKGSVRA